MLHFLPENKELFATMLFFAHILSILGCTLVQLVKVSVSDFSFLSPVL